MKFLLSKWDETEITKETVKGNIFCGKEPEQQGQAGERPILYLL